MMNGINVRIWGFAADGKTFNEDASFRSLSPTRAWIENVRRAINTGEVIGLQYEANRARVQVSSVDSRAKHNVVIAVDLISGQRCPWESLLDHSTTRVVDQDRRRYYRHRVNLPVELRSEHAGVPMRVSATDVCGNGCYLQTMATAPIGTKFVISFCFGDRRITCDSQVRTSDLGLGMGIEFTGLGDELKMEFQKWLDGCESNAAKTTRIQNIRTS
jgi:hypothetical protein